MILTLASSKGGVGKTTVTRLLAGRMAADGARVTVLDADPNAGMTAWVREIHEGSTINVVAETSETRVAELLGELDQAADLVLVDTAGFGNLAASVAMTGADAVLVPTGPGRDDLLEAARTVERCRALARAARRDVPTRVLVNRVQRTTSLGRHVTSEIENLNLPRLQAVLSQSVNYGEIGYSGRLPTSQPAAREIEILVAELRSLGWLPPASSLYSKLAASE